MNLFKHFNTITRHRHQVIKHCFKAGIGFQGLFHDLSKYSPTEFITGIKNYQGNRSPNEYERETKGYSYAWLHHKGRNRHHFEYWTDYNPIERRIQPIKMPLKYVAEMFCDRVAASKIYKGKDYTDSSALEYFINGKPNRFINTETSLFLEKLLVMLSERGEKETFAYLKKKVKEKKEY
jgi:hypothetical protein